MISRGSMCNTVLVIEPPDKLGVSAREERKIIKGPEELLCYLTASIFTHLLGVFFYLLLVSPCVLADIVFHFNVTPLFPLFSRPFPYWEFA